MYGRLEGKPVRFRQTDGQGAVRVRYINFGANRVAPAESGSIPDTSVLALEVQRMNVPLLKEKLLVRFQSGAR